MNSACKVYTSRGIISQLCIPPSSPGTMLAVKAEIAIFDNVIVLYKFIGDLMFFVTVSQDENELLMYTVLEAFHESVSLLLR